MRYTNRFWFYKQVLRHREPHPSPRVVQAVHVDHGSGDMDTGRGAGHAGGHVLARGHRVDTHDERDDRVLLPVPDVARRRLRQGHGHVQGPRVLRGAAVRDRVLLLPDGPPLDGVHAQHAGRAAARRPVGPDTRPQEGGQDGAVVRHHIHGELPAVPRVHGVVPLLPVLAGRVRRLLARVPHRRILPELHQLVREPGRAVLHQRRVPQTLQPVPVLLVPVRPVRRRRRRRRRVHRAGHQPDARQQHIMPAPQLGGHQPHDVQSDMTDGPGQAQDRCSHRRRQTSRGLHRRLSRPLLVYRRTDCNGVISLPSPKSAVTLSPMLSATTAPPLIYRTSFLFRRTFCLDESLA